MFASGGVRSRGLFALVALVFFLGEILGLAHLAGQHHEICPEHGELVHADHDEPGSASDPNASHESPGDPSPEHDEDSHCRVCASVANPTIVELASPSVVLAPPRTATPCAPASVSLHVVELYAVAPKTSPPWA